jgi:Glycosyltransferase
MRLVFNRSFLFFAEFNIRLFFYLLFSKADVFLSNDTDSILANYLAARLRRKKLIFDAHEMYPEVPELAERKFIKRIWTGIEDLIFPHLKYCYTVCQPIADIYNERYGIHMKVVRNIPFAHVSIPEITQKPEKKGKYMLFYQGVINMGRGIDLIIDAMPYLDNCIFYIAGDGYDFQTIKKQITDSGLEDRVKMLGKIPFEQLAGYTAYADIGMSLLENKGLNYYYSLPNRIFDFIRAHVPVLASDFPEIRKIVSSYEVGRLVSNYQPEYLASVIKEMLKEKPDKNNFDRANRELTWENESAVLLKLVEEAIADEKTFR